MRLFFVLLGLAGVSSAGAEPALSVAAQALYYDSREYDDDGTRLNREAGWVPGLRLRWQSRPQAGAGLVLEGDGLHGQVDYDGQTQSGAPFQSDTRMTQWRLGAALRYCPASCRQHLLLGWRFYGRDRDIRARAGVAGLYEEYRWQELSLGGRWQFSRQPQWSLAAEVHGVVGARLDVDLRPLGGRWTRLDLPFAVGAAVGLQRQFGQGLSLSLHHEWLAMDASRARHVQLGGLPAQIREPQSEAHHWRLTFEWHP